MYLKHCIIRNWKCREFMFSIKVLSPQNSRSFTVILFGLGIISVTYSLIASHPWEMECSIMIYTKEKLVVESAIPFTPFIEFLRSISIHPKHRRKYVQNVHN